MKNFDCPVIGRRPISEFICAGGGVTGLLMEDSAAARAALFFGDGTAKVKREWWYHRPSRLWFIFERDTGTDAVIGIALCGGAAGDGSV